ncbi:MAG: hypothetical protein Ta2B_00780 [Termitinemataceae bacterium]|nr:MAG: hypothetical protein Ta2B_00780 [Termitinemataceae bacterium]
MSRNAMLGESLPNPYQVKIDAHNIDVKALNSKIFFKEAKDKATTEFRLSTKEAESYAKCEETRFAELMKIRGNDASGAGVISNMMKNAQAEYQKVLDAPMSVNKDGKLERASPSDNKYAADKAANKIIDDFIKTRNSSYQTEENK